MVKFVKNLEMILKTRDFLIGTFFLAFLFLTLFLQETSLSWEQFLFALLFLLLLGGFFLYIFTPPLVNLCQTVLTSTIRCLIPPLCIFGVFLFYRIVLPTSTDLFVILTQIIASFLFILTPSLLYFLFREQTKNGMSYIDIIAGLWVWLPIEFGLIDDFLGSVELGNTPFDTLLALFAFIYALIFVREHDMGLTFSISIEDLITVSKASGILVLIILPLGILTSFLAPPDVIWENCRILIVKFPGSLVDVILTFLLIFLGTALIEEIFFRGFIFRLLADKLKKNEFSTSWIYGGVLGLTGLIVLTPWIDNILQVLSQLIPLFSPLHEIIGSLAESLGEAEGQAWPLVENIPLEVLYFIAAIILAFLGIFLIYKTQDPIIAALVLSSVLFGWAHFEDVRYIFFASIAGFAYGWTYWKTDKVVPAALVHMTVNTLWSVLFSF
ncbi:MAG: CPBP family intramembrane metalloprotease [Candidatus Heimdallarchaeota archaeon]|nr:MAG: CPBP family intramembrane metalloprotease [Candidatus Heimdallarchaeota archaeon]